MPPTASEPVSSLRRSSMVASALQRAQAARRNRRSVVWLVIGSLVIIAGIAALLYVLLRPAPNYNDVHVVEASVSKLYILPTSEQPALATVTNSSKLQTSFVGKLANGDKILIYQNNKQAIVYRPSTNKIVDVEPVALNGSSTTAAKIPNINPFGN